MINTKIKKILVPLDGSKNSFRGLDLAIALARQCRATITGIYSIYEAPHSEFTRMGPMKKDLKDEIEKLMNLAKTRAAENGILFRYKILSGNIGYNIVKFSKNKNEKYDLIVIGSRGRSSTKEFFFGSVSNYVLHLATVPVLVVK